MLTGPLACSVRGWRCDGRPGCLGAGAADERLDQDWGCKQSRLGLVRPPSRALGGRSTPAVQLQPRGPYKIPYPVFPFSLEDTAAQKHLDDDSLAGLLDLSGSRTLRPSQWARDREGYGCERWDLGAAHSCCGDGTFVLAVGSSRPLHELRRNVSLYIFPTNQS